MRIWIVPDLGAYNTLPARSASLAKGKWIGSVSPSRISSTPLVALRTGSSLAPHSIRNRDPVSVMRIGILVDGCELDRIHNVRVAAVQKPSSTMAATKSPRLTFHNLSRVCRESRKRFSAVIRRRRKDSLLHAPTTSLDGGAVIVPACSGRPASFAGRFSS